MNSINNLEKPSHWFTINHNYNLVYKTTNKDICTYIKPLVDLKWAYYLDFMD